MKKKGNRSVIGCLAAVCMLLPVMSCVYHDPDEDWNKNGKVRLMLNWKEKKRPVAMDYYFYQDGAARPVIRRGEIGGYEGTLPAGNYRVAVCNPDGANVELQMESGYESACAVARPASVLKAVSSGVEQPHGLYGTGGELLSVSGKTDRIAELYPVSLVRELELNIRVVGLSEVERLTGSLSGIAPEVHIPTGEPLYERTASVGFTPEKQQGEVYSTTLGLFGLCPDQVEEEGRRSYLSLTLTLAGGLGFTSRTDITQQVNEAYRNSLSTRIVLDLEVSPSSVDGITIIVTGWHEGTGEAGNGN
ncbi:hypothetical protein HMPREF1212_02760 [Parabacteroides sp. HGS0025]|uniref:DUF5119 domain-containing protein n=1 Tax=Parabacteroides sp. HGS0025 TaxID=1078087 RepID=UPI0006179157|nr:DUF5119 domain-containing protein [Parabacteroides sp. HGS0025]KKB52022.1 hypothetical protein HMPREF1212_02760 [Parabacteroides sp. HGS0025]